MSTAMEDEINRWTAKRKSALVMDILQGKTTVAEAARVKVVVASVMQPTVEYSRQANASL